MLAAKTKLEDAENVKQLLLHSGHMDVKYRPKKGTRYIYFPVTSQIKDPRIVYVDVVFDETKKKGIEDHLPAHLYEKMPTSYDIVGDIILIEIPDDLEDYEKDIGNALLKTHKGITTILKKSSQHGGEFRTQDYHCIAGIDKRETLYRENDIVLMLDVEKVYFSSRLSTERKRVYQQVKPGEKVLVMFSGCGPYVCTIAKNTQAASVLGIEKNPIAHEYAEKNIKLNKLKNAEALCGDVRKLIYQLNQAFDRIVMPLPKDADTFLDTAFIVSKKGTTIHLYDFEHETEIKKAEEKVIKACASKGIKFNILRTVKCGQYSPGKFRLCVDFQIR
jgi:tRNA (guanine37-N1)-methyltransferase